MLEKAGFEVVGHAADQEELMRKARAHKPDVAIIDIPHAADPHRRGRPGRPRDPRRGAGRRGGRTFGRPRGGTRSGAAGRRPRRSWLPAQGPGLGRRPLHRGGSETSRGRAQRSMPRSSRTCLGATSRSSRRISTCLSARQREHCRLTERGWGARPKGRATESVLCRWRSARADHHSLASNVRSPIRRGGRGAAAGSGTPSSGGTGRGFGRPFRRKRTGLEVNIFAIPGFHIRGLRQHSKGGAGESFLRRYETSRDAALDQGVLRRPGESVA